MSLDDATRDSILAAIPNLRAFGISLTGNVDRADDLVQETILRALRTSIRSSPAPICRPGCSPFSATFSVRNTGSANARSRDATGMYADSLKSQPEQSTRLEFEELRVALDKLPDDQREAVIWSALRASPTRKPPRSAAAPSARSRAASTARVSPCRTDVDRRP